MSNKLTTSNIPTTWMFGRNNGYTWNPVRGCANTKCFLHPNNSGECWAAKLVNRYGRLWTDNESRFMNHIAIDGIHLRNRMEAFLPTWFESQYRKEFPKRRSCIFVCSQTDIAYIPREWLEKILTKIVENNEEREKAGLPLHIFQFLTKNPELVYRSNEFKKSGFPPNCWLGFTAWDQPSFDRNLEETNHAMYARNTIYAYLEPLQGPIRMNLEGLVLDWVILGGKNGSEAPRLNPDWVRSVRDQCREKDIPFYFKQWGEWILIGGIDGGSWVRKSSFKEAKLKIFKKTGKLIKDNSIDDEVWEQFPEIGG